MIAEHVDIFRASKQDYELQLKLSLVDAWALVKWVEGFKYVWVELCASSGLLWFNSSFSDYYTGEKYYEQEQSMACYVQPI